MSATTDPVLSAQEGQSERSYAKRKSTVTAELAMKGHAVHDGPCGDFSVCRWGLAKYCQDIEALENFAVLIGARA